MSNIKIFDCVEMKDGIQAQMREEFAGLSDDEVRRRINQELESSNSIAARKWREILHSKNAETVKSKDGRS